MRCPDAPIPPPTSAPTPRRLLDGRTLPCRGRVWGWVRGCRGGGRTTHPPPAIFHQMLRQVALFGRPQLALHGNPQ
eukprot:2039659-Alexandrium_andersonii.AAC.1